MDFENFLGNIYFGSLDEEPFHSFKDLEEDDRAREVIVKYLEVTEKYPATELEEKGLVPLELQEQLKEVGFFWAQHTPRIWWGWIGCPEVLKGRGRDGQKGFGTGTNFFGSSFYWL